MPIYKKPKDKKKSKFQVNDLIVNTRTPSKTLSIGRKLDNIISTHKNNSKTAIGRQLDDKENKTPQSTINTIIDTNTNKTTIRRQLDDKNNTPA